MSNLNLKSTNFDKMVEAIKAKRGGYAGMIILGANTLAHLDVFDAGDGGHTVTITYHGNIIAQLTRGGVAFTNAGWGTSTTRNRLGMIAHDNNVPVSFGQRNWKQTLMARKRMWNGGEWHDLTDEFTSVVWNRDTDTLYLPNGDTFVL